MRERDLFHIQRNSRSNSDVPAVAQATPTITVSESGLITASVTQQEGRVTNGTKSVTKQLDTYDGATEINVTGDTTLTTKGKYCTKDLIIHASQQGLSIVTGDFVVSEDMYEPGVYEYVLTSNELEADTRRLILVGCTTESGLDSIHTIFRRNNTSEEFTRYDGSFNVFAISHTAGDQRVENNSTIFVYGGPNSNRIIDTMYFVAV